MLARLFAEDEFSREESRSSSPSQNTGGGTAQREQHGQLPEAHTCNQCRDLVLDFSKPGPDEYRALDKWSEFATADAVKMLHEAPALASSVSRQLVDFVHLCTISVDQMNERANSGCALFEYFRRELEPAIQDLRAGNHNTQSFDDYTEKIVELDTGYPSLPTPKAPFEEKLFIGVDVLEDNEASTFCFRWFMYPYRVFRVMHVSSRNCREHISTSIFRISTAPEMFQMMFESTNPNQPLHIPLPIVYDPGSERYLSWAGQWIYRLYDPLRPPAGDPDTENVQNSEFLPTRLLELDIDRPTNTVRLVNSKSLDRGWQPYATLSYCWGGDQKFKLTSHTGDYLRNGFTLVELPKTLQDAVVVATRLGIRHLWVDALCIKQDDELDKAVELARMADIYLNSAVTIAASRATSVDEGFLHKREPFDDDGEQPFKLAFSTGTTTYPIICYNASRLKVQPNFEPLNDRAWAYQERSLSRRLIEFGVLATRYRNTVSGNNVVIAAGWKDYQDRSESQECVYANIGAIRSPKVDKGELLKLWYRYLSRYSSLKLSFQDDRLPAISAIARIFTDQLGGKEGYMAGLWRYDMPMCLLWVAAVPQEERDVRCPPQNVPTWSWASISCRVGQAGDIFHLEGESRPLAPCHDCAFLQLETTQCTPSAQPAARHTGRLRLQGRLRPVHLKVNCGKRRGDHDILLRSNRTNTANQGNVEGPSFGLMIESFITARVQRMSSTYRTFLMPRTINERLRQTRLYRLDDENPNRRLDRRELGGLAVLDRHEATIKFMMRTLQGCFLWPVATGPCLRDEELDWGPLPPADGDSIYSLILGRQSDGTYIRLGIFVSSVELAGTDLIGDDFTRHCEWMQQGEVQQFILQ